MCGRCVIFTYDEVLEVVREVEVGVPLNVGIIRTALPYNNDLAKSLQADQHFIYLNPDDYLLCFESENSFSAVSCFVSDSWFGMLGEGAGLYPCVGQKLFDNVGRHLLQQIGRIVRHQVVDDVRCFLI